jgi:hypothetical protein
VQGLKTHRVLDFLQTLAQQSQSIQASSSQQLPLAALHTGLNYGENTKIVIEDNTLLSTVRKIVLIQDQFRTV